MPELEEVAEAADPIPRGYVRCWPVWWSPRSIPSDLPSAGGVAENWMKWLALTPQWLLVRPSGDPKERAVAAVVTRILQQGARDWVISVRDVAGRRYEWCLHDWHRYTGYGGVSYQTGGQAVQRLFIPAREQHYVDAASYEDPEWLEWMTFKVRTVAGKQRVLLTLDHSQPYPAPVNAVMCRPMCQPYFHVDAGEFRLGEDPVYVWYWRDTDEQVWALPVRYPWLPPPLDAEGQPVLAEDQQPEALRYPTSPWNSVCAHGMRCTRRHWRSRPTGSSTTGPRDTTTTPPTAPTRS